MKYKQIKQLFVRFTLSLLLLGVSDWVLSDDQKPNFVIIFSDDHGYGDLRCFGGEHVSTPRIDQMAADQLNIRASFFFDCDVCVVNLKFNRQNRHHSAIARGAEFTLRSHKLHAV